MSPHGNIYFFNGNQLRNCLHFEAMKTNPEKKPSHSARPEQAEAWRVSGRDSDGAADFTWPGTEAAGLCESQRMFAPYGLFASPAPALAVCLWKTSWPLQGCRHRARQRRSGGALPCSLGPRRVPGCSGDHSEGHGDWPLTSSCCSFTPFLRSRTRKVPGQVLPEGVLQLNSQCRGPRPQ